MSFDAIIFDCDGVLVDSEILGLDASAGYLRNHGFSWTPAQLVSMFTGYRDDVFAAKLTSAYQELHGRSPGDDFFQGLVETRRSKRHLLTEVEGASGVLKNIEHPMAVASSSRTEILESKMQRTALFDLFAPHIYSADRVEHGKPAPDIFLYTAAKLSVKPDKCVVIEDSANGVKAGKAAGMVVWGFLGGGHCFDGHADNLLEAGADRVVENFADLGRVLNIQVGK